MLQTTRQGLPRLPPSKMSRLPKAPLQWLPPGCGRWWPLARLEGIILHHGKSAAELGGFNGYSKCCIINCGELSWTYHRTLPTAISRNTTHWWWLVSDDNLTVMTSSYFVCMSICLSVCLSVCMYVCMYVWTDGWMHMYIRTYVLTYMHTCSI